MSSDGHGNQPENPGAVPAGPRNTHFDFQAKVFQAPGACFVLNGKAKDPVFSVDMGGAQGLISLKHLRVTFFIEPNSHDDKLIDKAAAGLHYVPDIRPGDEIPNEILDGSASWTVARRHKQIARNKLQVQLISWMTGKPMAYADQDDLKAIIESEENKKALKDAFKKAAVALGIDPNESEKVLLHIETLARELCYIEALRERTQDIGKIKGNLDVLTKVYNKDPRVSADITRMKVLIIKGIQEPENILNNIDAESADVLSALMSIDDIIRSVRKARDDLHFLMMEWDPVLAKWAKLNMVKSQEIDRALSTTYKFLAMRFSSGKSIIKKKPAAAPAAS
jgi:hypothetical protein